jgi:DNA-binding MarR family transcriptional regulator
VAEFELEASPVQLKRAEKRFKLTTSDYAKLAAFRRSLREFMRFSEEAAAQAGLTSKHYQAMLVLRACPDGRRVSINDLAQELHIKHNSAVELVDRLVQEKLIVRGSATDDRRKVELHLTGRGRQVLAELAEMHRRELQRIGPNLKRFFGEVSRLEHANGSRTFPRRSIRLR